MAFIKFFDSIHVCPAIHQTPGDAFSFDSKNKLQHVFTSTGINYVYLTAINNETGAPLVFDSMTVHVLP